MNDIYEVKICKHKAFVGCERHTPVSGLRPEFGSIIHAGRLRPLQGGVGKATSS
jgi:hypothetical protein